MESRTHPRASAPTATAAPPDLYTRDPGRPLAGGSPRKYRGPAPPGAIHCPACNCWQWISGRGLLVWILIILLFPLGLLFLLIQPKHRCEECGYTYTAFRVPPSAKRSDQFALLILAIWLLGVVGVILARNWSAIFP